jgi:hypothetical protein
MIMKYYNLIQITGLCILVLMTLLVESAIAINNDTSTKYGIVNKDSMGIQIDSNFPGGNIVVDSVSGDEVRIHQDLRVSAVDWFYWCFRVKGAAGRTLRFTFTEGRAIGVRGPAISIDGGETWRWLGNSVVNGRSFRCTFPSDVPEVRLSFAMPYQESRWQKFMSEVGDNPNVIQDTLCTTRGGKDVEYILLRCTSETPIHRVAITCRHHACEMMASYALEGLIRWIIQDDEAEQLRRTTEFFIVPFVDKDGVEDGDQGKGRLPRDHGRDYEGVSIFASTKAIREQLPVWGDGILHVGLDLHCPYISGPHNEVIYLVGSQNTNIGIEQKRFSEILESVSKGPLKFIANDFLPFGRSWNTNKNYAAGRGFKPWVCEIPNVKLGTSIEIPYANANGTEVNQTSARQFGGDLARGLAAYLEELD